MAIPTPEELERQKAIREVRLQARECIRAADKYLRKKGYEVRMGAELGFYAEDEHGRPVHITDENLAKASDAQSGVPTFKRMMHQMHDSDPSLFTPFEIASTPSPKEEHLWRPSNIALGLDHLKRSLPGLIKQYGAQTCAIRAKPYPDVLDTCGMHLNFSIWKDGKNLFATEDPGKIPQNAGKEAYHTEIEKYAIHALLAFQMEGMLAFAPQETSYERYHNFKGLETDTREQRALKCENASPNKIAFDNNRECLHGYLVKLKKISGCMPSNMPISASVNVHTLGFHSQVVRDQLKKEPLRANECRIENRLPGADADPYVAIAMNMAAIVYAIDNYERKSRMDDEYLKADIPETHEKAKLLYENSSLLKDRLDSKFYRSILAAYGSGQPLPPPERVVSRGA